MAEQTGVAAEAITLPKAGGAIRALGESFQPNLFTGVASLTVPLNLSEGRQGVTPPLTLQYSSGSGNGPFGLGWSLSLPAIRRKTERGLPRFDDSDVFVLSGAEDLVQRTDRPPRHVSGFRVTGYRPRTEGLFARIERWRRVAGASSAGLADEFWIVTTRDGTSNVYGRTPGSTIADPASSTRIFAWLLELTVDRRGDVIRYGYKPEDGVGVPDEPSERTRSHHQSYLSTVHYGALAALDPDDAAARDALLAAPSADADFLFTAVFDYGEHGARAGGAERVELDIRQPVRAWTVRPDPFSSYRATFEIRTHRRCKRVLMFHNHVPGSGGPLLVRSTDFLYATEPATQLSLLVGVTARGYRPAAGGGPYDSEEMALGEPGVRSGAFEIASLPRLDFTYSEFVPQRQCYTAVEAEGGAMPPRGLDDPNYALVDLFGTGLPDVVELSRDGGYYWRNLGAGRLGRRTRLGATPPGVTLGQPGVEFGDVDGNGVADLLVHTGAAPGFCAANAAGGWQPLRPYASAPPFTLTDPQVRLVDVRGSGVSDALRTDPGHFTVFPCQGARGFGAPKVVTRTGSLDEFPDVYFSDPRVRLADMTGDGLKDIALVHSGGVDYWPNLGYGRFGRRVRMTGQPRLPDQYDPARLFLVDVDGSGTADLVYVDATDVRVWSNQSGNGWSAERKIEGTPAVPDARCIKLVDFFGSGSSGILWSEEFRGVHQSNYLYLELTGGVKPYVLDGTRNNTGGTTRLKYASSTSHCLRDRQRGRPWATTTPFPVQVLERIETIDHLARTKLETRFEYHHGYYDGVEREFRGFGCVDQYDTRSRVAYNDAASGLHDPGTPFRQVPAESYAPPTLTRSWFHTGVFENDATHAAVFRSEYYQGDAAAFQARSRVDGSDAPREAHRALRGALLRTETYALDQTPAAAHPHVTTESGFHIRCVQPRGSGRNGVFYSALRESFTSIHERVADDPRVTHRLVYDVDAFGNPTKVITVAYARRQPLEVEQGQDLLGYDRTTFVNQDAPGLPYFVGLVREESKIQLNTGGPLAHRPLRFADLDALAIDGPAHRLYASRRYYYDGPAYLGLPSGSVGKTGLVTRIEALAFAVGDAAMRYGGRVDAARLRAAGYVEAAPGADEWWVQLARRRFATGAHFKRLLGDRDALGNTVTTTYDAFDLLPVRSTAPLSQTQLVDNDYVALAACRSTDVNGNRTQVVLDPLGMVTATVVMGRAGTGIGDDLAHPTSRLHYDLFRYWRSSRANPAALLPNLARTEIRERHWSDDPTAPVRTAYTYFDGSGRELQRKLEAEPDPAAPHKPRWACSPWSIRDNKGRVVISYEPSFADDSEFADDLIAGDAVRFTLDAEGRTVRADSPNGTFTRVEYGAWHQTTWDANDTSLDSAWYARLSAGSAADADAATKAAAHYGTPTRLHFDPLGRSFLSIEDNGAAGTLATRSHFDIAGNVLAIVDPRGATVVQHEYDMLKHVVRRVHMDSGERLVLLDAMANPVARWDAAGRLVETRYDALNRLTERWVTDGGGVRRLAELTTYGEAQPNAAARNLRGKVYSRSDDAGRTTFAEYDFRGNPVRSTLRLRRDYDTPADWNATPAPPFTADPGFEFRSSYDALGHLLTVDAPDGSRQLFTYGASGLLATVHLQLPGAGAATTIVSAIGYDAHGRRTQVQRGNGVGTEWRYDTTSSRIATLRSWKGPQDYQHLACSFDALGNITTVTDAATPTVYFRNAVVTGDRSFTYDAVNRLVEATGREQIVPAPATGAEDPPPLDPQTQPLAATALRRYRQRYSYDAAGNLTKVVHTATGGTWTRDNTYGAASNRLRDTSGLPGMPAPAVFAHDVHGNVRDFGTGVTLEWDDGDHLCGARLPGGGQSWYVHDGTGQRVRKLTRYQNGEVKEMVSVGRYEFLREYSSMADFNAGRVRRRRDLVHVLDDRGRVATAEALVVDARKAIARPAWRIRYRLADHLGSTTAELDGQGQVLTHEEYHPTGTTAYRSANGVTLDERRLRFAGQCRDSETGLYAMGARMYAPWLGRWVSCDPAGEVGGINAYAYVNNRFINATDVAGLYDPAAFGDSLVDAVNVAEEFYMVENTGTASSVWNTFVATVAEVSRGSTSIFKVGTGAAQGVEQMQNAQDGWDYAIGVSRILSDAGEVASTSLAVAGTATKAVNVAREIKVTQEIKVLQTQRVTATGKSARDLSEAIGELQAKKLQIQSGLSDAGKMNINSKAGNPTRHGVDKAMTGAKPFGKQHNVVAEIKGSAAVPTDPTDLLKTYKGNLTQGALDYNIDRLTKAASSGNANAANMLNKVTTGAHESVLIAADVNPGGGVQVLNLSGATGVPTGTVVSGLPSVDPVPTMLGTAATANMAQNQAKK